jgi:hypothetical protein
LPAALLRIELLVDKYVEAGIHLIVRRLWQIFENASPSSQQHQRFIHSDAYQPRGKLRPLFKVSEVEENFVKALLHHIFRILPVIGYAQRRGKDSPSITENQFLEGLRVSTLCGSN